MAISLSFITSLLQLFCGFIYKYRENSFFSRFLLCSTCFFSFQWSRFTKPINIDTIILYNGLGVTVLGLWMYIFLWTAITTVWLCEWQNKLDINLLHLLNRRDVFKLTMSIPTTLKQVCIKVCKANFIFYWKKTECNNYVVCRVIKLFPGYTYARYFWNCWKRTAVLLEMEKNP